jgi:hypothetical protein
VNTDNVYVIHQAVPLQSTNLLFAIKAGDRLIYTGAIWARLEKVGRLHHGL